MVPSERWRILVIDDNPAFAEDVRRALSEDPVDSNGRSADVDVETDFDAGLKQLETEHYDLLVLDVRNDGGGGSSVDLAAGRRVYDQIRERRFLPIVFFTGLPEVVRELAEPPLIDVVVKDEGLDAILGRVQEALDAGVPAIIRVLTRHFWGVIREYLWTIAPHWQEYTQGDPREAAWLLTSRLARSLTPEQSGQPDLYLANEIANALGSTPPDPLHWQPGRVYIYPPLGEGLQSCDLLCDKEKDLWYLVLTPACHLAQKKADRVLLASAFPLLENPMYLAWVEADSNSRKGRLVQLLRGGIPRYIYLPRFRNIPDLIVDLQAVETRVNTDGSCPPGLERIATLDSPFAEGAVVRYGQLMGSVGTPDTDTDVVLARLKDRPQGPDE